MSFDGSIIVPIVTGLGAMQTRTQLVDAVAALLEARDLSEAEAAKLLGFTEPEVANLMRGRVNEFSEGRLLDCLVRLGQDVHIVVNEKPAARGAGRISVLVMRPFKRRPPGVSEPSFARDPKNPVSRDEAELMLLNIAPNWPAH